MTLFYRASLKELLQIRNSIFLDFGLPALQKQDFQQSPFSSAWFGKSENVGFSYELCRLSANAELEMISVHMVRGDLWVQIFLNIFRLQPEIGSINQLSNVDGVKFHLPPNNISEMRLKMDDVKGPPMLDYNHMFRNHKLKSYYTKSGLQKRADELGKIIENDLSNIDHFVKRWHELHKPILTAWDGSPVK